MTNYPATEFNKVYFAIFLIFIWLTVLMLGVFGYYAVELISNGDALFIQGAYLNDFDRRYKIVLLITAAATVFSILLIKMRFAFGSYNRGATLKIAIGIYMVITLALTIYNGWHACTENNALYVGDWLINYQGGFVRRGLAGELVLWLSLNTSTSPGFFVFLVQSLLYFAFFVFVFLLLKRQESLIPYIFLIFSPFIFNFQLHDVQGGFRKEIIYFAVLSFVAWSAYAHKLNTFKLVVFLMLAVYPALILSHEALAVFLPYLLVIFVARTGTLQRPTVWVIIILLAFSVAALIVSVVNKGDNYQVAAICKSLAEYAPPSCESKNAIWWLSKSAEYGLNMVILRIKYYSFMELYTFATFFSLLAFFPIRNKLILLLQDWKIAVLIFATLIGTLPVFAVALDWGRLIYIHLVSIFIISLLPVKYLKHSFPAKLTDSSNIDNWLLRASAIETVAFSFVLFCYSMLWRIPHIVTGVEYLGLNLLGVLKSLMNI